MKRVGLLLLLACERAAAHPGGDLAHFISEPDHLAMLLLAALVIGVVWLLLRRPCG